ncbi:hypothetical protein CTEN210_03046 [Chaetoceros tenuissimus]|uniref:Uncharacterized protein n=1 Tax=Chaetoceros tenuissimus TaxID=426638 RepID=A0AAD3CI64_9STRA|nr:hypothetical protein CTEN210_03046 [Chaetoceros tenuissimus]
MEASIFSQNSEEVIEVDYDLNPTKLYTCICAYEWDKALRAADRNPLEAKTWVVKRDPCCDEDEDNEVRFLPLHSACARQPPLEVVSSLLSKYSDASNIIDDNGMYPLHYACANQASAEVIELLILHNPEANMFRVQMNGYLPIHLAAQWGVHSPAVVEVLLKENKSLACAKDYDGISPLEMAVNADEYEFREDVIDILHAYYELEVMHDGDDSTISTRASIYDKSKKKSKKNLIEQLDAMKEEVIQLKTRKDNIKETIDKQLALEWGAVNKYISSVTNNEDFNLSHNCSANKRSTSTPATSCTSLSSDANSSGKVDDSSKNISRSSSSRRRRNGLVKRVSNIARKTFFWRQSDSSPTFDSVNETEDKFDMKDKYAMFESDDEADVEEPTQVRDDNSTLERGNGYKSSMLSSQDPLKNILLSDSRTLEYDSRTLDDESDTFDENHINTTEPFTGNSLPTLPEESASHEANKSIGDEHEEDMQLELVKARKEAVELERELIKQKKERDTHKMKVDIIEDAVTALLIALQNMVEKQGAMKKRMENAAEEARETNKKRREILASMLKMFDENEALSVESTSKKNEGLDTLIGEELNTIQFLNEVLSEMKA